MGVLSLIPSYGILYLVASLFLILGGVIAIIFGWRISPKYWFVTNKRVLEDKTGGFEADLKDISEVKLEPGKFKVKLFVGNQVKDVPIKNSGMEDFQRVIQTQKRNMEKSKFNYCRECGEEVDPSREYCPNCGSLVK